MGSRVQKIAKEAVPVAAGLAAVWGMVFLHYTPRGERALRRIDRFLYPPRLTGEQRTDRHGR